MKVCVWAHASPPVTFIKYGGAVCVCRQVDELYEAFCIQSRLRDGASRMKQAFSSSPSTKGTKESIAEVNRRYKEYTEVLNAPIKSFQVQQNENRVNEIWCYTYFDITFKSMK